MEKRVKMKRFFTTYAFALIIIFIFSYLFFSFALDARLAYQKEEIFSLFCESYGIKNQEKLDELESTLKAKNIPSFNYYVYSPEDQNIASYYASFGASSDIIILKESDLNESKDVLKENFLSFNYLDYSFLNDYDYYENGSEKYALKIYDQNDETYNVSPINELFTFKESSYYLLINLNSIHFKNNRFIGSFVLDYLLAK